jgi:hypothetical protein
MWSLYAHAAPSSRAETGRERRKAYKPSGRDRKLLSRLKDAFSRLGEGFCWKRRLAYTRWSQWRLAVRGVQVGGGMPREAAGVHHGIAEEAVRAMEGAPGLEKRLYIQRKVKDPLRCRPRRRQRPTVIGWSHKPEENSQEAKTSEEYHKLLRVRLETIAWLYNLHKRLTS